MTIAADVMQRLWRPAPGGHPFPTRVRLGAGVRPSAAALRWRNGADAHRAGRACGSPVRGAAELVPSRAEPVLLHGGFNHENVLAAQREPWLAIVSKGVVGEPGYYASLLREPPDLAHAPRAGRVWNADWSSYPESWTMSAPAAWVGAGAVGARRILEPGGRPRSMGRGACLRAVALGDRELHRVGRRPLSRVTRDPGPRPLRI